MFYWLVSLLYSTLLTTQLESIAVNIQQHPINKLFNLFNLLVKKELVNLLFYMSLLKISSNLINFINN